MKTLYSALLAMMVLAGFSVPAGAHPCDRDPSPGHKHCANEARYEVELMGRVFNFTPPVTVRDDDQLVPDDPATDLTFHRPGGVDPCNPASNDSMDEADCAWDAVFAACENFFGDEPIGEIGPPMMMVTEFTVPSDDWRINKNGGVRLQMSIPFDKMGNSPPGPDGEYFSVSLQLYGDTFFESPNSPWLPGPGGLESYPIITASILGRTAKGIRPKKGCVSGGTAPAVDFDPGQPRSLVITAPAAE